MVFDIKIINLIIDPLENKLKIFTEHVWISLILIGVLGLFFRLYNFPFGVPITLDGLFYFWFAYDVSILDHLPTSYYVENDGWPIFLGFLLKNFHFGNYIDYVTFQRSVTIFLSLITIVPIYLLCRKFFEIKYALIGAVIFAFEPRIVQNSLLGISEPLYNLLITASLALFFNSNKKLLFASFGFVALATIVRAEGLFLFIAFSILYLIRFRYEKTMMIKYIIALLIFILILTPIISYRIENYGHDGILNKVVRAQNEINIHANQMNPDWISFGINGGINTIKFLGWDLIPIFIFFVPIGFLLLIKKRNFQNLSIILISIIMLGPAWFAYLNNADTRYLFVLYPLFCIFSLFTIDRFCNKFKRKNIILMFIIIGIFIGSLSFLEFKKIDYGLERDAFNIAKIVYKNIDGINSSSIFSKYVKTAEISEKWPDRATPSHSGNIPSSVTIFHTNGYSSIENFIVMNKDQGLTNLVIDDVSKSDFFNDVFYHEEKYPYLIKIYDSTEHGFIYHVKIFRIDYEKFS